jgi:phenylacetate-CoA ligase
MSGRLERIILRSPAPVRTLAANVKSWQLDRLRRGGDWAAILRANDFRRYFEMSWNEAQAEQNRRLRTLVARARQNVPYYRALAADVPEVQSVDDLLAFPLLSKAQARAAGSDLLDEELRQQRHFTGHTSGSTGTPFAYQWTIEALRNRFAMRDMFYALHGVNPRARNVRLGGRLFMAVGITRPPFWLLDRATNQLMFSLYHMSDDTLAHFLKPLARYRPQYVTGYPSSIHTLARYCRQQGFDFHPQGVFTDSETLLDHQRAEIEAAWDCRVFDYYGMEAGWLAGQCQQGRYHLSPLTSVIELLDEAGQPVPPGEVGEIVVTDLDNPLMPLIRYRTGDSAVWSAEPCGCGWHTPSLDRIEGRMDDVVVLPDGRRIGRLDHIFKSADHIRECQIVQETPSEFTFLLVPDRGYTDAIGQKVLAEAHARLGDVTITLKLVDEVQKTSRRKYRSVISKVNAAHGSE